MNLYECPVGHLSREPGTCHQSACFRRLSPVEAASEKAKDLAMIEALDVVILEDWVRRGQGHKLGNDPWDFVKW